MPDTGYGADMTKTPQNEPPEKVEKVALYPPQDGESPDGPGLVEQGGRDGEEEFEVPLGPEGDRTFM